MYNVARRSTTVSVGVASVTVVGANLSREEITIVNDHATQVVYLQLETVRGVQPTAIVGQGVRLNAAGGQFQTHKFKGAISAIASGAATGITVAEY